MWCKLHISVLVYRSTEACHLTKSHILKSSLKHTCYITDTTSDVSRISLIITKFPYFPQDVSEAHTLFHSTELELVLHSAAQPVCRFWEFCQTQMCLYQPGDCQLYNFLHLEKGLLHFLPASCQIHDNSNLVLRNPVVENNTKQTSMNNTTTRNRPKLTDELVFPIKWLYGQ